MRCRPYAHPGLPDFRTMSLFTAFTTKPLAFLTFATAWPLSFLLPNWFAWENGPIETIQIAVLGLGFIQSLKLAFVSRRAWRGLWIVGSIIWLVLVGREMSWGAVLYAPAGFGADGPMFSSRVLWYRAAVAPCVIGLAVVSISVAIRFRIWCVVGALVRTNRFPFLEIGMATVSLLLMTAAENHLGMSIAGLIGDGVVFEEAIELAAYCFLFAAQKRVYFG